MANEFRPEIEAVNRIRSRNREIGQRTLARMIKRCQFPHKVASGLSSGFIYDMDRWDVVTFDLKSVPEATIYNRIRRYDKKNPKRQAEQASAS